MGQRKIRRVTEQGRFLCPRCETQTRYALFETTPYHTILGIAYTPAGKAEREIECLRCEERFAEDVIRQPTLTEIEEEVDEAQLDMQRLPPARERSMGKAISRVGDRYEVGQRVLGRWDFFWYPGTIENIQTDGYRIQFDDGDFAVLPAELVGPLDIVVGDRVYCRRRGGPRYFPATVKKLEGERINLLYDDGRKETTRIASVRVVRGKTELPWKKGERVFAVWPPNNFLYPGEVKGFEDYFVSIAYANGDRLTVTPDMILPLEIREGDLLFVRKRGEYDYMPSTVRAFEGDRFLVQFEDGSREWTTLGRVAKLPPTVEKQFRKERGW